MFLLCFILDVAQTYVIFKCLDEQNNKHGYKSVHAKECDAVIVHEIWYLSFTHFDKQITTPSSQSHLHIAMTHHQCPNSSLLEYVDMTHVEVSIQICTLSFTRLDINFGDSNDSNLTFSKGPKARAITALWQLKPGSKQFPKKQE